MYQPQAICANTMKLNCRRVTVDVTRSTRGCHDDADAIIAGVVTNSKFVKRSNLTDPPVHEDLMIVATTGFTSLYIYHRGTQGRIEWAE